MTAAQNAFCKGSGSQRKLGKLTPENMQLLTREQHREKTRHDLRRCWKLREGKGDG